MPQGPVMSVTYLGARGRRVRVREKMQVRGVLRIWQLEAQVAISNSMASRPESRAIDKAAGNPPSLPGSALGVVTL